MTTLKVTEDKCIIANGLKLCKVENGKVVFFDPKEKRKKRRELEQGDDGDVRVDMLEFMRALVSTA